MGWAQHKEVCRAVEVNDAGRRDSSHNLQTINSEAGAAEVAKIDLETGDGLRACDAMQFCLHAKCRSIHGNEALEKGRLDCIQAQGLEVVYIDDYLIKEPGLELFYVVDMSEEIGTQIRSAVIVTASTPWPQVRMKKGVADCKAKIAMHAAVDRVVECTVSPSVTIQRAYVGAVAVQCVFVFPRGLMVATVLTVFPGGFMGSCEGYTQTFHAASRPY